MTDKNFKPSYLFTIIIYNTLNSKKQINNITNQTINFQEDVQLIIIYEKEEDIINNLYENNHPNITLINSKCANDKEILNSSKNHIKGKYVNILSDSYYPLNTLEEIKKVIRTYPKINIFSLSSVNKQYFTEDSLAYDTSYKKLNINKNPQYTQLNINATFIKTKLLFEEKFYEDDKLIIFLNKILFKYKEFIRFNKLNCFNENKKIYNNKEMENTINFCNELTTNFLSDNNKLPVFIQYALITTLDKVLNTIPDHEKANVINENSYELYSILKLCSVKTMVKNLEISRNNRCNLMSLKNKNNYELNIYDNENILLTNKNYTFTFIICITENTNKLFNTINSIFKQNFPFEEIQIIIASNTMNEKFDESKDLQKEYPENIFVIYKAVPNIAALRNLALAYIKSDFVNFIECGDEISNNTLEEVKYFFDKNDDLTDICIIPRYNLDDSLIDDGLEYIFELEEIIDVTKNQNTPLIYASSAFISYSSIKLMNFSTNLLLSEDTLLLNKILLDKKRYGIIKDSRYYPMISFNFNNIRYRNVSRKKHYNIKDLPESIESNERYYMEYLNEFYQKIIEYCINKVWTVPPYIQNTIVYDMVRLINIPELEIYNSKKSKMEFYNRVTDILQYIDNKFITKNRHVNHDDKNFLMYMKNKYHLKVISTNNTVKLESNSHTIDRLNGHKLGIDNIHIKNGNIHFLGYFVSNFKDEHLKVKMVINNSNNTKIYPAKQIKYSHELRKTKRYLSIDWKYKYNFELIVPICDCDCVMKFQVTYDNGTITKSFNPIVTFKKNTGLNYIHNFREANKLFYLEESSIRIVNSTKTMFLKNEIRNLVKIYKDKKENYLNAILLRGLYLLTYPIMKNKEIWLLNDRLNSSDDNAKHLFDYAIKQKDNINIYYVIGKDCEDYGILKKKYKNILAYSSLKHKLLFLYNNKIISSFLSFSYYNPFFNPQNDYRYLYGDLINSDIYFLQHGVSARNANHFKRFSNELSLIVTTSDKEKEYIDKTYNYPEEITQSLGFPRYDNLTNDRKKVIIYMPTWRSYLNNDEEAFKNSDFFKIMKEFLNDKKLHELLNENGYSLKFKPHPELFKYMDLFDLDENVKISTDEPYQQLFREGSILISDFSSVLFDFAYLKKPIIYYQPRDDHQYEEGYFNYENMGFGKVTKYKEELINIIREYIEKDCQMEDLYIERVNDFYKHTDRQNSRRVYEWIKEN